MNFCHPVPLRNGLRTTENGLRQSSFSSTLFLHSRFSGSRRELKVLVRREHDSTGLRTAPNLITPLLRCAPLRRLHDATAASTKVAYRGAARLPDSLSGPLPHSFRPLRAKENGEPSLAPHSFQFFLLLKADGGKLTALFTPPAVCPRGRLASVRGTVASSFLSVPA